MAAGFTTNTFVEGIPTTCEWKCTETGELIDGRVQVDLRMTSFTLEPVTLDDAVRAVGIMNASVV